MTEVSGEKYKKAVNDFYRVYVPARQKYSLRMDANFSMFDDGVIEIWRYERERRVEQVCKVKEVDDVICYKRAKREIEDYVKKMERERHG